MTKKKIIEFIKFPGMIDKVETMHDRSLKIRLYTQELTSEDKAHIIELQDKPGWFLFAEIEPTHVEELPKDLPEITLDEGEKSPSQRLRGVLYRVWEGTKRDKTFELFYRDYMEKFINNLKDKYLQ